MIDKLKDVETSDGVRVMRKTHQYLWLKCVFVTDSQAFAAGQLFLFFNFIY